MPDNDELRDEVAESDGDDERVYDVDVPADAAVREAQRVHVDNARQREDVRKAAERTGEPAMQTIALRLTNAVESPNIVYTAC